MQSRHDRKEDAANDGGHMTQTELPKYSVDIFAEPDPDVPEERWIRLRDGDLR